MMNFMFCKIPYSYLFFKENRKVTPEDNEKKVAKKRAKEDNEKRLQAKKLQMDEILKNRRNSSLYIIYHFNPLPHLSIFRLF